MFDIYLKLLGTKNISNKSPLTPLFQGGDYKKVPCTHPRDPYLNLQHLQRRFRDFWIELRVIATLEL
jgi:hypothetical protein